MNDSAGATLKTIVRKNLILRLAVPRFFVQGDEVVISGIVHNYLTTAKQARVSVKLEGLDLVAGTAVQRCRCRQPRRGQSGLARESANPFGTRRSPPKR